MKALVKLYEHVLCSEGVLGEAQEEADTMRTGQVLLLAYKSPRFLEQKTGRSDRLKHAS